MRAHRFARQSDNNELSELETFPILQYLDTLSVADCEIDIGELAVRFPNFSNLKNDSHIKKSHHLDFLIEKIHILKINQ